jgi:hypothetical protein
MSVWTEPVAGRFKELFAEGLSYNDIAEKLCAEFGVTISRNAAIGFGKRRNMPKRKDKNKKRKAEVRLEHRGKPGKDPGFVPMPYRPRPQIGKGTLRIEQLTSRSCRWPFGDEAPFLYCGALTEEETSYCCAHNKLAHTRWQPTAAA